MDRIIEQFFSWQDIRDSLPAVLRGFRTNIALMFLAEACVLVWALFITLLRGIPGRAAAPLRWFAIAYVDVFRGLPAIVVIYLVGFGLPQADLPIIDDFSLFQLGTLALTLVYGAYVAEVYRSGIDGVHWSQAAAARSLGLSAPKAMRYVILPQAVRKVIPPLLNDFIGLQKDTALVGVLGLLEGFRRAQIYAGRNFNASSLVGLGICFVIITIPMARFVDWLVLRDQRRQRAMV